MVAKRRAQAHLKGTIRAAKCKWADDYIQEAQVWEVASWRHGWRLAKVPPLKTNEGLAHIHEEIVEVLTQQFFGLTPPRVEVIMEDDPPEKPTCLCAPVNQDTVAALLDKTTNHSTPGQSRHSWMIIKWALEAHKKRLLNLLEVCLKAGHRPKTWKEAVVCMISKPKRTDYSLVKNFRPISLLECLRKLLEKIVARLVYRDLMNYPLVPSTQFGGRNASSTLWRTYCWVRSNSLLGYLDGQGTWSDDSGRVSRHLGCRGSRGTLGTEPLGARQQGEGEAMGVSQMDSLRTVSSYWESLYTQGMYSSKRYYSRGYS